MNMFDKNPCEANPRALNTRISTLLNNVLLLQQELSALPALSQEHENTLSDLQLHSEQVCSVISTADQSYLLEIIIDEGYPEHFSEIALCEEHVQWQQNEYGTRYVGRILLEDIKLLHVNAVDSTVPNLEILVQPQPQQDKTSLKLIRLPLNNSFLRILPSKSPHTTTN